MATENIKLRKRNFTVDQGYFYVMEEDRDNLLQKTDDGNTCFSYPLDTLLSMPVLSLEFDGVNFWTLEQTGTGILGIKRWKIDNYIAKLKQTVVLSGTGSHTYNAEAFSVEHYHDTLASGITASGTDLYLSTYGTDTRLMEFTTTSGGTLQLHLGPNSNDEEEDVYVSVMIGDGGVSLISGTRYSYDQYDPVNFYTYLWIFNNYNGTSSATGALYKIDPYTGDYIKKYAGGAYSNIKSATFYKVDSFTEYGPVDTLAYIKSTNTLFIDVSQEVDGALRYYGSMSMSNIQSDEYTTIDVFDMAMDDQNVYRLQLIGDGASSAWSVYSYQLSSLDSFVTSISLAAYPAIIAANSVSTTDVVAIVKDQFLQPIVGRLVTFTDDDTVGYVVNTPVNTDGSGVSQTSYRAGTSAREVKITATVSQT